MNRFFGALLCWFGRHDAGSLGCFHELFVGRLHLVEWERCGRCKQVTMTATPICDHCPPDREGGGTMRCQVCGGEHEPSGVELFGSQVFACPDIDEDHIVMVRPKLSPELVEKYERAAVALENHNPLPLYDCVEVRAWDEALRIAGLGDTDDQIDEIAVRLLRNCIVKGEPLP